MTASEAKTSGTTSILDTPEFNIAVFAFLLNFIWEMLQVPFFNNMASAEHWPTTLACTKATFGDAVVALISFWIVAAVWHKRGWLLMPRRSQVLAFIALGVIWTIAFEGFATQVWHRWSYSAWMPVIPGLHVALIPILQWILLPPLIIWFSRRQIRGGHGN